MTRAAARFAAYSAIFAVTACSSSSSAPSEQDASVADVAPRDGSGGLDVSNPFPTSDSAPPAVDAGSECDQLRAQVLQLQPAARACNPQSPSPCNGSIDGICCPITVSFDTGQPVDDFTQALKTYKSKCTPDCTMVICGQTPSNVCIGGAPGTKGQCQ